ncbi:hypothetical protein QBC43DRAFT_334301 [Cladorrhinum sp. PSN259]|nr:hypothetical protein QBC43DRAFT_334301 [Cladorrhinum sp. PSN259]
MRFTHTIDLHLPLNDIVDFKVPFDTPTPWEETEENQLFSQVENIYPATRIQYEVAQEPVPWAKSELGLERVRYADLSSIANAWRALASYHSCLRATLRRDPDTAQLDVVVYQRIEDIVPPGDQNKYTDDRLAHLTLESSPRGKPKLYLNFRRALIDGTSLKTISHDFNLLLRGLPPREHTGFGSYLRFLSKMRNSNESNEFWHKTLDDAVPRPLVPKSAIFKPAQGETFGRRKCITEIVDNFDLPRNMGMSRQIFFELVWALVLRSHTGSDDVLFGAVRRDAHFVGVDNCIGYLDQTYLVRLAATSNDLIKTIATRLQQFHDTAASHAFVGLDEIRRHLAPGANVDSVVTYSQVARSPQIAQGLVSFPVALNICDSRVLVVALTHVDEIDSSVAEILLQHFVAALRSAAAIKDLENTPCTSISLISDAERSELLARAGTGKSAVSTTITALFEKAVSLHSSRVAVEFGGDEKLTFEELNTLANSVAHTLQLQKGDIVPILMDRSLELIVSILAVLKSGAAYTVLDPESPAQRLEQVVDDCSPSLIIAQQRYSHMFPQARAIEDLLAGADSKSSTWSNPDVDIRPEDKCYIIYTSGSTGNPKGAVLTHGAAASGMASHTLNGLSRWLLFYNPSFSAAQRTMLSTLVHGGTLLITSKDKMATDVAGVINDLRVDALGITPSALSLLRPADVPHLKQVVLVGERIPESLVDTWASTSVLVRNTYGLSECTQLNFGRQLEPKGNPRVVGNPADTTSAYILQPGSLEMCPTMVAGELCLAGPQLASGYLNQPGLTAKVFVDNPFGPGKLYRTGDMARRLSDFQIEILGRLDLQVKINGQKVEPAEVDRCLFEHEAVASCASVAVEMEDGQFVLVAALVLADGRSLNTELPSIRQHMRSRVPGYMVPSYWLPLVSELPKNANGKTDYQKLKRMVRELGTSGLARILSAGDDSNAPLSETEAKVAKVWGSVIGLDLSVIGRGSSFTVLGGNSLQAIKAVSELRRAGLVVDFATIFSDESLEKVATTARPAEGKEDQEVPPFFMLADLESASRLSETPGVLDAYPATPFQAALLTSIDSDADPYTYQRVWSIQDLDIGKLRDSFEQVFQARDILRTGFIPHGKTILQVIREDWDLPWHETHGALEEQLAQDRKQKLPLSGPLFRLTVVSEKYLVVTMHHSLFDFWSHSFLYEDVAAAYLGKQIPQRPKFKKFVQHLLSQNKPDSLGFWKEHLQDASPSCLNYAPVHPRARLETQLAVALTKRAQSLGVSSGAIIYAAWAVLLSRHLGTQDVVFGTTLSGREAPILDIHNMDGPTMTTVPQRIEVDPGMSLIQLVKAVQAKFPSVVKHSQVGLQEALRSANARTGLFDTLVNILVKNGDADQDVQKVFKRHGKRQFWDSEFVVLEVEESQREGGTQIRLAGDMELRRLEFLSESFSAIVQAILHKPDQKTEELDIMGVSERAYLADELSNRATLHVPAPELLHAAFERWAHQSPDTVAIDWEGTRQVTYAELNQLANRVAHLLVHRGVKPGDRVPLMLNKSVDTMVSLLGVMKAGAAYVPLNPENPVQRNSFIVEDTAAKHIIIHKEYADFVASVPGLQALTIDNICLTCMPSHPPSVPISPDHLAYIIYTSGSTGQPKGVKVPHRSASTAVTSMATVEGRYAGTWRTLQFANYVFDASVQDFFNTLSTGGTLCMAPTERLLSDIVGSINTMDVRQAIITPTVARLFKPADVPGFEKLIVGGEPLTHDVVETWKSKCQILNVYGPTETSMVVTTKDVQLGGRIGNIGAPFPTVMAFILAPDGQKLMPYGAVGELCIGGPQVTAGYVNRDDLTNATYVHNNELGLRLYRTGDLARWLPGGEIECLGRKDNQVKVHGHRIELGEVESAIRKTGLVKDVVALVSKFDNNPRLVAFCIFREDNSLDIQDVAEHIDVFASLRASLDSLATYMVPKFVIPMGSFPKLPSRKVDRKALQKKMEELGPVELGRYVLETVTDSHEIVPTETAAEEALERMWSELFSIPTAQIGREANFLTLGGDSIYAISLASMARQAGYMMSVPNILRSSKLKDMAATMQQVARGGTAKSRAFEPSPAVQQRLDAADLKLGQDIEYIYPCPPGQTEFLTQGARLDQMWVLQTVRRMPASADPERWLAATRALTQANEILRTTWLQVSSVEWVGCVLRNTDPDVVRVPCRDQNDATIVAERIWAERFVFPNAFIRYAILSYPSGEWDVLIKMDHAVYDGTLLRIFDTHFAAILAGQPIPPHTEFKEFTELTYQGPKAESLQRWTAALRGKAPDNLLARNPAPKITQFVKEKISTPGVDDAAGALGVTTSTLFQGAFELWLSRFSASTDVNFDYLISGRNVSLPDPQTINGTLATFLPVRTRLDRTQTVPEFLGSVQDDFWDMTEHADVSLDEIYRDLKLDREVYGNSVLFLFQPFDPEDEVQSKPEDRWLVMAKSKVRMYQPYALVVEVAKAVGKAHVLKIMYDPDMFDREFAGRVVREMEQILGRIIEGVEKDSML